MKLEFHPLSIDDLRELVEFRSRQAGANLDSANEVIVFGSVARGVDGPSSDLDVLCCGEGKRCRSRGLDLVFVSEEKRRQHWWLGSELAGHVAHYGVWTKGEALWTDTVFISSWSRRKKAHRVLRQLADMYTRRNLLARHHLVDYLERTVLEVGRLDGLERGVFVPTTAEVKASYLESDFALIRRIPQVLGAAPALMFDEIVASYWDVTPLRAVREMFQTPWTNMLRDEAAWRAAGRPALSRVPEA